MELLVSKAQDAFQEPTLQTMSPVLYFLYLKMIEHDHTNVLSDQLSLCRTEGPC